MAIFKSHRGISWNYHTVGEGQAVLFIHGFAGSSQWWENQVEFLKQDFQVITIDLPGHGQSSWMPVNPKEMAVDIAQILALLHVHEVNIVASSMGGLIAFELYRHIPQAVMRMSFVGSLPKLAQAPGYLAGLNVEKIRTLSNQFDGNYASILDIFFRSLFTMKERDSEAFKLVKELRAKETLPNREALKYFLDIIEKYDLRDRIASVICPLQFIRGKEDYICTQEATDWVSEHTFNARFDVIDACGHLPFLTDVKEYNRMLEDFLLS